MIPRVSVVIPVYNRPKKVLEAVESVRAQTVSDWEVILVDDGSKDETPQVLRGLEKQDRRIRAVFQENKGAQSARNAGIRASRGEWTAFLDSDDFWLPRSLESRLEAAEKDRVSVVHSDCEKLGEDGTRNRYGIPPVSGNIYRNLLQYEGPMFQALLVRKSALEKVGYLDESIVVFQEWDTSIRLSKHFPFAFVPEPTFVYDCRGNDTISKQFMRNGRGYEQVIGKFWLDMWRLTGAWTMVRHYEGVMSWYERAGNAGEVARCRRRARLWRLLHGGSWKSLVLKKMGVNQA